MATQGSAHRLPSVSAIDALQGLAARGPRTISTGLAPLDKLLAPPSLPGRTVPGGLVRGKVTEVYGPAGVGKTAFGIQAAANALRAGLSVVWVEAGAPLVSQRLRRVLAATADTASASPLIGRFHHCRAPTLAHLLALLVHPPPQFPPRNTALVVIDSLATLLDDAYPRNAGHRARAKGEHAKWAAGRRLAVIGDLSAALARMAAVHDIALLVACQTSTRIRGGARALLVPAISGTTWDNGISTRLVLFRDWVPAQEKSNAAEADGVRKARFVGLVKLNGVILANEGGVGNVVPYSIEDTGLCDVSFAAVDIAAPTLLAPDSRPPKRRFSEIGDSEEEELDSDEQYGWVEDDEVATEGLLVEDATLAHDDANSATTAVGDIAAFPEDHIPDTGGKGVVSPKRTATI